MDEGDGVGGAGGEGVGVSGAGGGGGPGMVGRRWLRADGKGGGGWGGVREGAVQPGTPPPRYGPEAEDEIVRRVAAGESLHQVCADAELPCRQTVGAWLKRRPAFAERLAAAQRAAGRTFRAPASPFCEATFEAIFERLCMGEGMIGICRDPGMPAASTVYRWMQARAELREAVELARRIHGDRVGELAFDQAMAATPETARLAEVRLRHLRWWAARLAPRVYGAFRASEPPGPPPPPPPKSEAVVCARSFWVETRADGWRRVRGSRPNTATGTVVDEPPGDWEPPPEGWESPEARRVRVAADQAAVEATLARLEGARLEGARLEAGRAARTRPDDPEGWL